MRAVVLWARVALDKLRRQIAAASRANSRVGSVASSWSKRCTSPDVGLHFDAARRARADGRRGGTRSAPCRRARGCARRTRRTAAGSRRAGSPAAASARGRGSTASSWRCRRPARRTCRAGSAPTSPRSTWRPISRGIQRAAVQPVKIFSFGIAFSTAMPVRKRQRSTGAEQRQAQQVGNAAQADDATVGRACWCSADPRSGGPRGRARG